MDRPIPPDGWTLVRYEASVGLFDPPIPFEQLGDALLWVSLSPVDFPLRVARGYWTPPTTLPLTTDAWYAVPPAVLGN